MPARLNHLAIPTRNADASAAFLGELLQAPVERDGADNEFPCLRLANSVQILFQQTEKPGAHHIAFQVTPNEFAGVVDRLRRARIAFGNDPEAPTNGNVTDPLGGSGRVYFVDPDGHLFEVCA